MRIVGEISHAYLKITVLHMNNRLSIKFENGNYEQTYKIRENKWIQNLNDCKKLVDEEMLEEVEAAFKLMHKCNTGAFNRNFANPEAEEFETII